MTKEKLCYNINRVTPQLRVVQPQFELSFSDLNIRTNQEDIEIYPSNNK